MPDELYDRQELLKLKPVPSATVVGVGGTGSWTAQFLAMSGTEKLFLMDADRAEVTNFNRLPVSMEDNLNKNKTDIMSELIRSIRPKCSVVTEGRATGFTLGLTEGIIFDCTDNQDTQKTIYEYAKENNREYIRVGYDGTHITVTDRVPAWKVTGKERTGYEIYPSWVVPAAMAACLAVTKAMHSPDLRVISDIGQLKEGGEQSGAERENNNTPT